MEYYVDYYWQDGLLTQQMLHYYLEVTVQGVTRTEEVLISSKFVYDESNQPVGCVANGEAAYAFVRNLQGDIIAVVDQDGETLVEYSYDPWGKVTSTRNGENLTQLESSVIAVMCPFAYRGYNYDFTTGLYYLQSRYYNPEWGRFLNCDDTNILLATKGETLGANLFAYCNNNPVNRVDYEGLWGKDVHLGVFSRQLISDKFNSKKLFWHGMYVGYVPFNYNKNEYYGTTYWALQVGFDAISAKNIGLACNEVDTIYSPLVKPFQGWHFNINEGKGLVDSRLIIATFMLLGAFTYLDIAANINDPFLRADMTYKGLKYLGYALHPLQDYYAHTDNYVYTNFLMLKSHVKWKDVDNAEKRWSQVVLTREVTITALREVYIIYKGVLWY